MRQKQVTHWLTKSKIRTQPHYEAACGMWGYLYAELSTEKSKVTCVNCCHTKAFRKPNNE